MRGNLPCFVDSLLVAHGHTASGPIAAVLASIGYEKIVSSTPEKLCNPHSRLHEDHVFVPPRSIYAQMEAYAKASVDTNAS